MTPTPTRIAQLFVLLASPGPSWHLKICRENEYILKTDQSDSKSTLIYLKWFQSDPKVCKMAPKSLQNDPKTASVRRAVRFPGILLASWASKVCRENEYIMFMDPFGSDTKPYDMHYMCHSTSICHFWHPFLHFPIIFSHYFDKNCCQSDFKLNSELHKTIKIYNLRSLWTSKPCSLETSSCLGGKREAKSIPFCKKHSYRK